MGLSDDEFYCLTPAKLNLLLRRHRDELLHREMTAALTTSAIINCSMSAPDKWVPWTEFAPHFRNTSTSPRGDDNLTDKQRQMVHDHNVKALEVSAQLRAAQEKHARR